MSEASQVRIAWVDNLKAIGILLVVLTHHQDDLPKWFVRYVYSFHVPLFFFASGYVFRPMRYTGIRALLINKTKTLLIPYFILSFLTLAFHVTTAPFQTGEIVYGFMEVLRGIAGIIISSNDIIWMVHNPPLWFLTSLFLVECCFYGLYKVSSGDDGVHYMWVLAFLVFIISILGALYSSFIAQRLPWGFDTALTGTVLFFIGFSIQERKALILKDQPFPKALLAITLFLLSLMFSQVNEFVNLGCNRLGNIIFFYSACISGIGLWVLICKEIRSDCCLRYLGKNSLLILGMHLPAFVILRGILKIIFPTDYRILDGSFLGALSYTVMQLVIIVPAIYLINRRFRFILGRW